MRQKIEISRWRHFAVVSNLQPRTSLLKQPQASFPFKLLPKGPNKTPTAATTAACDLSRRSCGYGYADASVHRLEA